MLRLHRQAPVVPRTVLMAATVESAIIAREALLPPLFPFYPTSLQRPINFETHGFGSRPLPRGTAIATRSHYQNISDITEYRK